MSINNNLNGYKFERAQMWWWHDPTYQNKANNIAMPKGEAVCRHDRPVIIIQDQSTIETGSVLVVPCSSSTRSKCDLAITDPEIQRSYTVTYLRCDKIMSVDVNQLSRYMLTLNEETMERLEQKIAKLIFPNLKYDWNDNKKVYYDDKNIRHIKSTQLTRIKLYSKDTIDEIPHSKWNEKKIKEFCEDYINHPLWMVSEKYNLSELGCTKLFYNWRDFCDNPEIINYNKAIKWTPEQKAALVKLYYEKGCSTCMEEYGLSKSTIRGYVSKFKERHPKLEKIEEVEITSLPFPDLQYAAENVIWFSNIITKTCKAFDMYHSVYTNYRLKNSQSLTPEGFYSILRNAINDGILSALNIIKMQDNSLYVQEILPNDKYINSWKLLDICKDDLIPQTSSDGVNLMKECRRLYGNKIALHVDIINEIRRFLHSNLTIAPAGINMVYNTLINIYCDPDEVNKLKTK